MRLLQVRELLEERAQLQSEKKDLDQRIRGLQEKANESAALRTEVHPFSNVGASGLAAIAATCIRTAHFTKECMNKCAHV